MNKIRIAVFGISRDILYAIRRAIDPRRANVVVFFDNDESKQEVVYGDIPVLAPSREIISEYSIDYIVVTALSSYENIYRQLVDLGISKDKIQVFAADELCRYCIGSIDNINTELIKKIYFEAWKRIDIITEYKEIYNKYAAVSYCDKETDAWFNKSRFISHACGGIVNGKRTAYSNAKEAFQYSMEKGFKLIECDVLQMNNKEMVLAHDYDRFYEAEHEGYTMMKVDDLLILLQRYETVSCLIDVKWNNHDEYAALVDEIEKQITKMTNSVADKHDLKKRVIMEVYDEETMKIAKSNDFELFFTQYRNKKWRCFMNVVNLCHKYGVKVVGLSTQAIYDMEKFVKIITDKGIKIFVYSVNDIDEYSKMRRMNIAGVFTDYLVENAVAKG